MKKSRFTEAKIVSKQKYSGLESSDRSIFYRSQPKDDAPDADLLNELVEK